MDLYHEGLKFEFVHSYIWCVNCNVWSPVMPSASLWCRRVVVIATAQLHSTKPEPQVLRRFKSCSQRVGDSRW